MAAGSRSRLTVEQLLEDARQQLERRSPKDARTAVDSGALLVEIRSEVQRMDDGDVPAASCVARNVLEWRLDPSSAYRDPELARRDSRSSSSATRAVNPALPRRPSGASG